MRAPVRSSLGSFGNCSLTTKFFELFFSFSPFKEQISNFSASQSTDCRLCLPKKHRTASLCAPNRSRNSSLYFIFLSSPGLDDWFDFGSLFCRFLWLHKVFFRWVCEFNNFWMRRTVERRSVLLERCVVFVFARGGKKWRTKRKVLEKYIGRDHMAAYIGVVCKWWRNLSSRHSGRTSAERETLIGRHFASSPQAFCNYIFSSVFVYNYEEKITNIHPESERSRESAAAVPPD